jgi:hypothetical protein
MKVKQDKRQKGGQEGG